MNSSSFLSNSARPSGYYARIPEGLVIAGRETVTAARPYHWDGQKRGGDPANPFWLFQYSLSGFGIFRNGTSVREVHPGQAFFTPIPSSAVYYRSSDCERWEFFWIMIRVPFVVNRFLGHPNLVNEVICLQPDSPILRAAQDLFQSLAGGLADNFRREELLFRWMLECERWASRERHPLGPQAELLEFVRTYALEHLKDSFSIEDLAAAFGMTRSNFSHHFRKITGLTPALCILQIRLEEAAHRLRTTGLSIKEVAAATGFTSSNHLCKCFRRHFQMSPGNFRQVNAVY